MQGCYQQFYIWGGGFVFVCFLLTILLASSSLGLVCWVFFSGKLSPVCLLPRLFMFERLPHLLVLIFTCSFIPIGLSFTLG